MHNIERPINLSLLHNTPNTNLASPLTNHLNVDPMLAQGPEEQSRNAPQPT